MIVLSDQIRVIQEYDGKSKFDFWHDIKHDDILIIGMELKPLGKYKPILVIKNHRTKQVFRETINAFQNYLKKITYESVEGRNFVV